MAGTHYIEIKLEFCATFSSLVRAFLNVLEYPKPLLIQRDVHTILAQFLIVLTKSAKNTVTREFPHAHEYSGT